MMRGINSTTISEYAKGKIGEESINIQGLKMTVISYRNYNDIDIIFENGHIKNNVRYDTFKNGQIKDHNVPTVYGVGIVGDEKISKDGKVFKEYRMWNSMLQRCFSVNEKKKKPNYITTNCCDEWLYYQKFKEWMSNQENYNALLELGEEICLDKDILIKGNNTYSPRNCCLVPKNINSLFTKHTRGRGNYPIGVSYNKRLQKYNARCNDGFNNEIHLGYYQNVDDAFAVYKKYKEDIIKKMAQYEFKRGSITKQCYDAMLAYEVDIKD